MGEKGDCRKNQLFILNGALSYAFWNGIQNQYRGRDRSISANDIESESDEFRAECLFLLHLYLATGNNEIKLSETMCFVM